MKFYSSAWLQKVHFHMGANFRQTTFRGSATFNCANFNQNTTFNSESNFEDSIFESAASFTRANFGRNALFHSAQFGSAADFVQAQFFGPCEFVGCTFEGRSDYGSASFLTAVHFNSSKFSTSTPEFRGCEIEKTRLKFGEQSAFRIAEQEDNEVQKLSFIKRLADQLGQVEQSLRFNALELSTKRRIKGKISTSKVITWVYEKASKYGQSVGRPLAVYLALLIVTYFLALCCTRTELPKSHYGSWQLQCVIDNLNFSDPTCTAEKTCLTANRAAFEYTLYRAVGVLDFSDSGKATDAVAKRLFNQSIEPCGMCAWGVFKGIASAALLFLIALGLRNRYRIK
jgi:Pentapeptide repeats (9 copies)